VRVERAFAGHGALAANVQRLERVGLSGVGQADALGIPEVFVPAGFGTSIYEPTFKLKDDGSAYEPVAATAPTPLASPLPFNIAFWSGPGEEARVLKVASAYEAATHHRRPPPSLGPVTKNP